MKGIPTIFEDREIRRLYDEKTETWFFSVVDIVLIFNILEKLTHWTLECDITDLDLL